jgi:hypothetical protein
VLRACTVNVVDRRACTCPRAQAESEGLASGAGAGAGGGRGGGRGGRCGAAGCARRCHRVIEGEGHWEGEDQQAGGLACLGGSETR